MIYFIVASLFSFIWKRIWDISIEVRDMNYSPLHSKLLPQYYSILTTPYSQVMPNYFYFYLNYLLHTTWYSTTLLVNTKTKYNRIFSWPRWGRSITNKPVSTRSHQPTAESSHSILDGEVESHFPTWYSQYPERTRILQI